MKKQLTEDVIINIMDPKIKKLLYQTSIENRDDLEQELKVLVLKSYKNLRLQNPPNVIDLLYKYNYL